MESEGGKGGKTPVPDTTPRKKALKARKQPQHKKVLLCQRLEQSKSQLGTN